METNRLGTLLLTAVAPVAWGSTYVVTETLLPPDRPLFAATVRALPAGLLLLALRRRLPHGHWWWKAIALGLCNIGLFFPLIFLSAYHLPGGLAATLQATSPIAVMGVALLLIGERPTGVRLGAAGVGLAGVTLLVLRHPSGVDAVGLVAATGSVLVSAVGFVLVKRWSAPVDMLTLVSWQLVVGGLVLLPVGLVVEGAPPAVDLPAVAGFVWLGGVGTALAYCVLVPRAAADVGRGGLARRAGQPGGRDGAGRGRRPRGLRLGAGAGDDPGARQRPGRPASSRDASGRRTGRG